MPGLRHAIGALVSRAHRKPSHAWDDRRVSTAQAARTAVEALEQRTLFAVIATLVDPFTAPAVDATKWNVTNRGLENTGDAGYDAPSQGPNGLVLGGTTNNQYWFGSSLESKDVFSSQAPTTVSVDRASLTGTGSAFRSSLWLLQPNGQFLHFAENVGEGGWQYNQTGGGGGTLIPTFNTATGNDGGLHNMKLVYTPLGGTNAKVDIYLDNNLGATANFTNWDNSVPFETIVTGQGRASGDVVSATFKNFNATAGAIPTQPPAAPTNLALTITPGNANAVNVSLTWTDNAADEANYYVERSTDGTNFTQVAQLNAVAATGGTATFTDNDRAASGVTYSYRVRAFNSANNGSYSTYSNVVATVPTGGTLTTLVDPLTGNGVDASKWIVTNRGIESIGDAGYNPPTQDANGLVLGGTANNQYWYGSSLESKGLFSSKDPTTVSVDRVSLVGADTDTAYRSSLWIRQPGGQFLHFSQNVKENGWQYNQTGGGGGTTVDAFNNVAGDPLTSHTMKLVYSPLGGTNAKIDIYLDNTLGGTANFTNWDNSVPFEAILTGQARAAGDTVAATFKNFSVVATPPSAAPAAPSNLTATLTAPGTGLDVALQWKDNSDNEDIFAVERSTDGTTFTQVGTVVKQPATGSLLTFNDLAPAAGTQFTYRIRAFNSFNGGTFSTPSNVATVTTAAPLTSLVDPLTGDGVNAAKWNITGRGLENVGDAGYFDPSQDAGGLVLGGNTNLQYWFGRSLESKGVFSSQAPTTVSVDRLLLNGSGTAYRSSLWLRQPTANGQFLHFAQNVGENGWEYNQTIGGSGTTIPAFNDAAADPTTSHNMKLVYTPLGGTNAKVDIFLDDVQGPSVNFTNWDNSVPFQVVLTGQARATNDNVGAVFKNFSAVAQTVVTPTVSGVGFADSAAGTLGQTQRSIVRNVLVTFNQGATLTAAQLTLNLLNSGGSGANDGSAPTNASVALGTPVAVAGTNGTVWSVPIKTGTAYSDASGSLANGIYTLSVSGVTGGAFTQSFHRLFGDQDGNKSVNNADYVRFRAAFGTTAAGGGAYNSIYDFDGNGSINNADYVRFRSGFGTTYSYT